MPDCYLRKGSTIKLYSEQQARPAHAQANSTPPSNRTTRPKATMNTRLELSQFAKRNLYGGAISVDLPAGFVDAR
jgi:hypothetical protein